MGANAQWAGPITVQVNDEQLHLGFTLTFLGVFSRLKIKGEGKRLFFDYLLISQCS